MNHNSEILDSEDVLSIIQSSEAKFYAGSTLKIKQLIEEYKQYIFRTKGANNSNAKIYEESIECEILRKDNQYQGWRRGKIKFVVQFEPDVSENNVNSNALDDIRKQLDTTN